MDSESRFFVSAYPNAGLPNEFGHYDQTPDEMAGEIEQYLEAESAKGRRLTALEALDAYGLEKLQEAVAEGSALLAESPTSAGQAIRARRLELGMEVNAVAMKSGLPSAVIEALEASKRRPIREYERAARILGLDERMISVSSDPVGNDKVAVG